VNAMSGIRSSQGVRSVMATVRYEFK